MKVEFGFSDDEEEKYQRNNNQEEEKKENTVMTKENYKDLFPTLVSTSKKEESKLRSST